MSAHAACSRRRQGNRHPRWTCAGHTQYGRRHAIFLLPGGGQKHAESLHEALRREFMEEVGVPIEVGDLVLVRDYIARNHEFADQSDAHQLDLYFRCKLLADEIPANGPHPDSWQVGVEWLELLDLDSGQLYPKALINILSDLDQQHAIYIGDVN